MTFEKKEKIYSGIPHLYNQDTLRSYVVDVRNIRNIDGGVLQRALDRVLIRMPYFSDTIVIEDGDMYYAANPLPMLVKESADMHSIGGSSNNYHMVDVTYYENVITISMFHGLCDGRGLNMFIEALLYNYYSLLDGKDYDDSNVRTDSTKQSDAETVEPFAKPYERSTSTSDTKDENICVNHDAVSDAAMTGDSSHHKKSFFRFPEATGKPKEETGEISIKVPTDEFMKFVKAIGSSPSVVFALMMGEAVKRIHPHPEKPIMAYIPMCMRKQLGCESTFKNCSDRTGLVVSGGEMDKMTFDEKARHLRKILKANMSEEAVKQKANELIGIYHKMDSVSGFASKREMLSSMRPMGHDTYYMDYIGRLPMHEYSDRIVQINYLSRPLDTLHVNIIENGGFFQINVLYNYELSEYADALVDTFKIYGITTYARTKRSFILPIFSYQN